MASNSINDNFTRYKLFDLTGRVAVVTGKFSVPTTLPVMDK